MRGNERVSQCCLARSFIVHYRSFLRTVATKSVLSLQRIYHCSCPAQHNQSVSSSSPTLLAVATATYFPPSIRPEETVSNLKLQYRRRNSDGRQLPRSVPTFRAFLSRPCRLLVVERVKRRSVAAVIVLDPQSLVEGVYGLEHDVVPCRASTFRDLSESRREWR